MAVLDVVVADLLVGESLECLGDVDPVVVDGLEGDVLGRVLTGFVGVQCEREFSVVLLDGPLVGRLRYALDPSPHKNNTTRQRHAPWKHRAHHTGPRSW